MVAFLTWLLLLARSRLKSRARLEAENMVPPQQVIVLRRRSRTRIGLATTRYFGVLKGVSSEIRTRWRSGVDSNSRCRLFSAKPQFSLFSLLRGVSNHVNLPQ